MSGSRSAVLDIDVNDQRFKDFIAQFDAFKAQLAALPAGMAAAANAATAAGAAAANATATAASATTTAMAGSVGQADLMTAALLYQIEVMKEQDRIERAKDRADAAAAREKSEAARKERQTQVDAQREEDQRERDRQRTQEERQKKVQRFLHDTRVLATGVGLALLGVGGGGIWGIDSLARSVSDQRKFAQGLGITTGENSAFQTNFGSRLVGEDFLNSVQDIKSDPRQSWMFDQMGIHDAGEKDTADLGVEVIRRARQQWEQAGPQGHNQLSFGTTGLSGVMDYSTYQRIGQASPEDMARYEKEYRSDVGTMSSSDYTQRQWQDFSVQLHRAGRQIENTFVNGLQPLLPGLTQMSVAITKVLASFLSNPHWDEWMKKLGDGMETLAGYLGSDKFDHDLKQFIEDIAYAAEKIHGWMDTLGLLPSSGDKPSSQLTESNLLFGDPLHVGDGVHWLGHKLADALGFHPPSVDGVGGSTTGATGGTAFHPSSVDGVGGSTTGATGGTALGRLVDALGFLESGNRDHPRDTYDGPRNQAHQGRYQMSEDMQRKYGITNPYDYSQVRPAAEKEEGGYLAHFHGNAAQAIAAWNEGQPAVDRQIAAAEANRDGTGRTWLERASDPVQRYVQHAARQMNVQVSVLNQTGAQVAVSHNAALQ